MKKAITLILLIIAKTTLTASPITENADDYCSKDSLDDTNLSNDERNDLRESRETPWADDYKDIINYLKDPEHNSEDWFEMVKWESIILIIFMIVVFICFIVFIVSCCACQGDKNSVKACTVMGCICLWIFMILFVVSLVFFSGAEYLSEDFLCSIFKMPSGALDGINDSNNKFIGLNNLKEVYKNLSEDIPKLTSVDNSIDSILNANNQNDSNEVWISSLNFYNTHKNSEIADGVGVIKKPKSVLVLKEGVNFQIATEITNLDNVAYQINGAASRAKNFVNNPLNGASTLESLQTNLSILIKKIEDFGDVSTENYKISTKYARFGYWFMIVFGILSLILFMVVFIIMCRMCASNKCWNCLKCGKALVVILSLMLLIYLILIFNMFVGATSLSGICGFLAKFEENSKTAMDEFPEINPDVRKFVETCMTSNASGDLSSLMGTNFNQNLELGNFNELLDGITKYRKWKKGTTTATSSASIGAQKDNWDQNELAFITDFENVPKKLEELNDYLSCSDQTYQITKDNCEEDDTNCKHIFESDKVITISLPDCVEKKAEATLIFKNLQTYQDQEVGLMNLMQQMVSETTNPDSVQSKFIFAKTNLLGINDDVVKIEDALKNTLKISNEFDSNWLGVEDCRALRIVLLQFEDVGCFKMNYYFYVFYSVSCICALIWFIMLWCACCAFRSPGDEEEEEVAPKPVEEDLDVDDKEKMPFY